MLVGEGTQRQSKSTSIFILRIHHLGLKCMLSENLQQTEYFFHSVIVLIYLSRSLQTIKSEIIRNMNHAVSFRKLNLRIREHRLKRV